MHVVGYLLSILIGASLGLIGGGGSILTVPILVYAFGIRPELSTSYSLFIVGLTSMIGSIKYFNHKMISVPTAFAYAIPSLISVWITRSFIVPAIPSVIHITSGFIISKDYLILIIFAVMMVVVATSMIKKSVVHPHHIEKKPNHSLIFVMGICTGLLTGFLGAGGGFLIIPVLVLIAKLPMKKAIGTSLMIISINSFIGFTHDVTSGVPIDYKLILLVSVFTLSGIFIGFELSHKISGEKLKPAFGWVILLIGAWIIVKETLLKG